MIDSGTPPATEAYVGRTLPLNFDFRSKPPNYLAASKGHLSCLTRATRYQCVNSFQDRRRKCELVRRRVNLPAAGTTRPYVQLLGAHRVTCMQTFFQAARSALERCLKSNTSRQTSRLSLCNALPPNVAVTCPEDLNLIGILAHRNW